jgi:hypothetical protein
MMARAITPFVMSGAVYNNLTFSAILALFSSDRSLDFVQSLMAFFLSLNKGIKSIIIINNNSSHEQEYFINAVYQYYSLIIQQE